MQNQEQNQKDWKKRRFATGLERCEKGECRVVKDEGFNRDEFLASVATISRKVAAETLCWPGEYVLLRRVWRLCGVV